MRTSSVAAQYADEAAFLWTTRARAVGSARYSLASLATLDERIEAHLDGLRLSGEAGWAECRKNLEDIGGGETFALGVLAFEADDRQRMLDALTAGCVSPAARRGLVSALGWVDSGGIARWIGKLLKAKSPLHRTIGIAACAARREDPGEALAQAIQDKDVLLRARGLRAAGELNRRDLLGPVREHLEDEDEPCRFWASWALALLDRAAGVRQLAQWLGRDDRFGRAALELSLRAMPLDEGRDRIRRMARKPEERRSAVVGVGVLGDPTSVPWLIDQMAAGDVARLAGEAFTMLTGVDLEHHDLDRRGPPEETAAIGDIQRPSDEDPAQDEAAVDDPDEHLPWPQHALVERWWTERGGTLQRGVRYLAGLPLSTNTARRLLATGTQPQRAAAALELALREQGEVLFEVRAKGATQRRLLSSLA